MTLEEYRAIDLFAIRCWGSGRRRFARVAYEVKVSLSDYRAEIAKPSKRTLALELSHQYAFAMPAELAMRVLLNGPAVPVEAGLVAIDPEGSVRDLKRAPIRLARPFTEREIAHLVRHRAVPAALRHAQFERAELRRRIDYERSKREQTERELEAAHAALARVAGETVTVGSVWRSKVYGSWIVKGVDGTSAESAIVRACPIGREWAETEIELGRLLTWERVSERVDGDTLARSDGASAQSAGPAAR